MEALEKSLTNASEQKVIPGAVVAATNASGSFRYVKAFGYSLPSKQDPKGHQLENDTLFMIASCTKLLTAISALQCVEKGLFGLDDDVSKTLPELAALEILTGFDDNGKPVTRKRRNSITLRRLLTHTAGLGYDFMTPKLQRYRTSMKQRIGGMGGTVPERYNCPLIYEPGTSWGYSTAMDYAGLLVERLTGQTLEEHMRENIWKPLGIEDQTFWPSKRPELVARLSSLTTRDPDGSGKVIPFEAKPMNEYNTECFGGGGGYSTMPEYLKVLRSLLVDDEKLLKKPTAAELFLPQLPEAGRKFMNSLRDREDVWSQFVGTFPREVGLDWSLGGILALDQSPGGRGKHTLMWSGLPNLFWVFPPGDTQVAELITQFEKAMYQQARQGQSKI